MFLFESELLKTTSLKRRIVDCLAAEGFLLDAFLDDVMDDVETDQHEDEGNDPGKVEHPRNFHLLNGSSAL